jgi:hypothetical protein
MNFWQRQVYQWRVRRYWRIKGLILTEERSLYEARIRSEIDACRSYARRLDNLRKKTDKIRLLVGGHSCL